MNGYGTTLTACVDEKSNFKTNLLNNHILHFIYFKLSFAIAKAL